MLCSKNVSILASHEGELELWDARRYRFARQVAALWFQQLKQLQEPQTKKLQGVLVPWPWVKWLKVGPRPRPPARWLERWWAAARRTWCTTAPSGACSGSQWSATRMRRPAGRRRRAESSSLSSTCPPSCPRSILSWLSP